MPCCRIPDPFLGLNELDVEWVGEKSWTYRTVLPPAEQGRDDDPSVVTVLAFDGLDTFATVKLNGQTILESDNMFIPHRVDVTNLLKASDNGTEENVLEIDFAPALLRAREIQRTLPKHRWICWNGEPARLGVRKAQYHWGWDWGPVLMCAGPWRPVRVERYRQRLADLWVEYEVDVERESVKVQAFAEVEGVGAGSGAREASSLEVVFSVRSPDGEKEVYSGSASPDSKSSVATVEFTIDDANLWFPHGYGAQPLYTFTAELRHRSHSPKLEQEEEKDDWTTLSTTLPSGIHKLVKKIGLRHVELVQRPDKIGKTFYFRINGVEAFCGGSNWIPADNFTPRISEERYRRWLQTMVDGNQIMVR